MEDIHVCDRRKFSTHTKWECKYHVVFIPKYRKKAVYGMLRNDLGGIFHELARQKESQIEEGHIMVDHIHMLISIHPKYKVRDVIGFIKGKSAIWIAKTYSGRHRNFTGASFWVRGYYVTTVGRDEQVSREYIRNQEKNDKREDQLSLPLN